MGIPKKPKKVMLFIGTLFNQNGNYYQSIKILEKIYGKILMESPLKKWDYSDYYANELGTPIHRRFIFFKELISEEDIADIKLETNKIEAMLSIDGKRTINLDPGYIGLSKIVLVTTKDYSHRIYIKNGIYGEVTLIYRKNSFVPQSFTYRDYTDEQHIKVFNLARDIYKKIIEKKIFHMSYL